MISIKNSLIAAVVTVALSGCGDDRSHPNDGKGVLSPTPQKPVAELNIDKNSTTGYTEFDDDDNNSDTLAFRWFSASDKLVFDGNASKDLDSVGTGVLSYNWRVKNEDNTTMSDNCINTTTVGSQLVVKICDEANDIDQEKFSVTLTVIDDENQTDSAKKTVTIY